jgi:chemotaxis response regulator CheB
VQDPAEAVIPGMPESARRLAGADGIVSLATAPAAVEAAVRRLASGAPPLVAVAEPVPSLTP